MHPAAMKRSIVRDSAAETTHNMMSALRDALLAAITVKPTAGGGAGCIQFRACAVLYLLRCELLDWPRRAPFNDHAGRRAEVAPGAD